MAMGKVFIVDDDPSIRASLSLLLETEGIPSQAFDAAESFLAEADLSGPGCVVADLYLPGMSGLDLLCRLRRDGATLPVIIITGSPHVAEAVRAMKEGASDFMEKPFGAAAFLSSVREALNKGEQAFHKRLRQDELLSRRGGLTLREREVMDLIVEGLSNKAAAVRLDISVRTVEIHRARVMEKMGAENLSSLVRLALCLEG